MLKHRFLKRCSAWLVIFLWVSALTAAEFRTKNFSVTAPTARFARQACEEAERQRKIKAKLWFGVIMKDWPQRCPIRLTVGQGLGAGGATSYACDKGKSFGFIMSIQGDERNILESVIPHEVNHTVFATMYGCPTPRWIDEGSATSVEADEQLAYQRNMLNQFMRTGNRYNLQQLFTIKEYPQDSNQVMMLYSQGWSVSSYLISLKGQKELAKFLKSYLTNGNNWNAALFQHYKISSINKLETRWIKWYRSGSPMGAATVSPDPDFESKGKTPKHDDGAVGKTPFHKDPQ